VGAPLRLIAEQSCTEKSDVHFEVVKRGAEEGNWLSKKDANRLYFVLTECVPGYERLIASQGRLIGLQEKTIRTSSAALALSGEIQQDERERGDAWKKDALETRQLLAEERERANSFFRSPVLWATIGAAVMAAVAIGLAHGLKGAQ